MKFYQLTLLSKNKNSLNDSFLFFLNNLVYTYFHIIKKRFNKKKKKKFLTILKSPHVNKTAQEQFEIRVFSRQLNIYSINNLKYLIFLKKIKNKLFPDIYLKIQFFLDKKNENNLKLKIFDPNNFKINTNYCQTNKIKKKLIIRQKNFKYKNIKKIKHFIIIFDIYGEFKKFYK